MDGLIDRITFLEESGANLSKSSQLQYNSTYNPFSTGKWMQWEGMLNPMGKKKGRHVPGGGGGGGMASETTAYPEGR